MAIQAFPLCWPDGRPRTTRPERSRFDTTLAYARDALVSEIHRLGGEHVIMSTNVPVRKDGLFYASARAPDDPGVAVYFQYRGSQHCFSCDKWDRLKDNVQAIRKTIESLRGIARWGTGDMMERAFSGFAALPDPDSAGGQHWSQVLDVPADASVETIRAAYRRACRNAHPDTGGNTESFHRVHDAWEQARRELGLPGA